jgi:hypothetical protein
VRVQFVEDCACVCVFCARACKIGINHSVICNRLLADILCSPFLLSVKPSSRVCGTKSTLSGCALSLSFSLSRSLLPLSLVYACVKDHFSLIYSRVMSFRLLSFVHVHAAQDLG